MAESNAIRRATVEDADLLASIIRTAFADVAARFELTPENAPKHPSNCRPDWVRDALNKGVAYWVIECDGRPAGCVALETPSPEVRYLERLAVTPDRRGRGLGRMLAIRALEEARRSGAEKVGIGIIAAQLELRAWYKSLGFVYERTARFDHLPFEVGFMSLALK
jgi:N-acetylglutamate synthase-like GNAT family acetyltransferase